MKKPIKTRGRENVLAFLRESPIKMEQTEVLHLYPISPYFKKGDQVHFSTGMNNWTLSIAQSLIKVSGSYKFGDEDAPNINNLLFLFEELSLFIDDQLIDTVRDPGLTIKLFNFLRFEKHNSRPLEVMGLDPHVFNKTVLESCTDGTTKAGTFEILLPFNLVFPCCMTNNFITRSHKVDIRLRRKISDVNICFTNFPALAELEVVDMTFNVVRIKNQLTLPRQVFIKFNKIHSYLFNDLKNSDFRLPLGIFDSKNPIKFVILCFYTTLNQPAEDVHLPGDIKLKSLLFSCNSVRSENLIPQALVAQKNYISLCKFQGDFLNKISYFSQEPLFSLIHLKKCQIYIINAFESQVYSFRGNQNSDIFETELIGETTANFPNNTVAFVLGINEGFFELGY